MIEHIKPFLEHATPKFQTIGFAPESEERHAMNFARRDGWKIRIYQEPYDAEPNVSIFSPTDGYRYGLPYLSYILQEINHEIYDFSSFYDDCDFLVEHESDLFVVPQSYRKLYEENLKPLNADYSVENIYRVSKEQFPYTSQFWERFPSR